MLNFFIFFLIGGIAGTLSGLLGIGGGSILVPSFLIGLDIPKQYIGHVAIATSTCIIFFSSIFSSISHFKHSAIHSKILIYLSIGALIGAFLTANFVFTKISSPAINIIFIIFLLYTSITTLIPSKKKVNLNAKPINYILISIGGMLIASISSIVGVGGGFLTVPFLLFLGISIHQAIATSAGLGVVISLVSTVSYMNQSIPIKDTIGFVYYPVVLMMIPASMLMAIYGSKLAHKFDANKLKRIYGYFLILLIFILLIKMYLDFIKL